MERLTERNEYGRAFMKSDATAMGVVEKLAEYEDLCEQDRITIWDYPKGMKFYVCNCDTDFTVQDSLLTTPDNLECYYDFYFDNNGDWLQLCFSKDMVGHIYFITKIEAERKAVKSNG